MKLSNLVFAFTFILLSCSSPDSTSTKPNTELGSKDSKLIEDSIHSMVRKEEHLTTHIIDVQCDGEYLPLRKRIITPRELRISQLGSTEAKRLNNDLIIDKLYNGKWVKLLKEDTLGFHYVQVIDQMNNQETQQRNIRGYIISDYCGQSTLKKMERFSISNFTTDNEHSKSRIDFIEYYTPNGDLLDYAYAYISPDADLIQVLSFAITDINEIRYKLYQVTTQHDTFFYTGIAVLENKYQNGLDMDLSRFITNNEMGPQFEIHINDDDSSAFLKLENKFNQRVNYLDEDLQMQRIK